MSSPRRPPGHESGFTLLEMLATLLLVATASTLIWQALASVSRIETRLSDSSLFATDEALRREWVRQALAGTMTGAVGDPYTPRGEATVYSAYTSQPPWPGSQGPEPMRLSLRTENGVTSLMVDRASTAKQGSVAAPDAPEAALLFWPGVGRITYQDHEGRWHDRWPPFLDSPAQGLPPPRAPRAIHLAGPMGGGVLAAVPAGNNPMLRRVDLER